MKQLKIKIFLLSLLFVSAYFPSFSQSFQFNESDFKDYLSQIGLREVSSYDYILLMEINNFQYLDREWIGSFANAPHSFKQVLMIFVISEHKQVNIFNSEGLKKENIAIDSSYTYKNQSFYQYYPLLLSVDNNHLKLEEVITYDKSYIWWHQLYNKYRN